MEMEPAQGGIRLQGDFLDHNHLGCENVLSLLDALGAARLRINPKVPLQELHDTVRTLNSLKLEAGSILEFHSLDFQALPASVEVVQRKFGWRQLNLGLDNTMSEKLFSQMKQMMDLVEKQPWSDAKKEEFRLQTESFLVKTIERMDTSLVRSVQSQRNLEDVLMLGASVVQNAIASLDGDEDPRTINQVFNKAAESLAFGNDSDSIKLMFEVLREGDENHASDDVAPLNVPQPDETEYSESINDLKTKVMQISATATEPAVESADYSLEILSICLKMACGGFSGNPEKPLRKLLAKQLTIPLKADKSSLLENAISDLIALGDRKPVDQILPLVFPRLMRSNSEAFAQYLNRLGPLNQPEKIALFWPHLVAMMLRKKPPQNTAVLEYLNQAIGTLPEEMANEEAHRLDFLPVVQAGKMGTALLAWPLSQNRIPLKALLAGRQNTVVGQQLHLLWMEKAPNKLTGVLMRVLGPYFPKHQKIYATILDFGASGNLSPENQTEFAKLIQGHLKTLGESHRSAGWITHAISLLGQLGSTENLQFLEEIMTLKRRLVLHAWPKECRQEAQAAASKISEEKRGDQR